MAAVKETVSAVTMEWYSVGIEAEGAGLEEGTDDALGRLRDALDRNTPRTRDASADAALAVLTDGIVAPVVSWGGSAGGPAMRASVCAADPLEATRRARDIFKKALEEAALAPRRIARIDVMTEEYQDAWLAEEPEEFVGVAEIADVLGVSRQRVSELRGRSGFPRPAADLAAGPVWRLSSLQRFVSDWPRRPGRPDTREARFKELELLAERAVSDEDDSMIRGRGLTSREREVLALIAEGRSLTEIAELLGLKGKTLDSHMRSVVAKFRAAADSERSRA